MKLANGLAQLLEFADAAVVARVDPEISAADLRGCDTVGVTGRAQDRVMEALKLVSLPAPSPAPTLTRRSSSASIAS